jgi:hypothetical protein
MPSLKEGMNCTVEHAVTHSSLCHYTCLGPCKGDCKFPQNAGTPEKMKGCVMKENHRVNTGCYYDLKFHIKSLKITKINVFVFVWTKFEVWAKLIGQDYARKILHAISPLLRGYFGFGHHFVPFWTFFSFQWCFSFSHFGQVLGEFVIIIVAHRIWTKLF